MKKKTYIVFTPYRRDEVEATHFTAREGYVEFFDLTGTPNLPVAVFSAPFTVLQKDRE